MYKQKYIISILWLVLDGGGSVRELSLWEFYRILEAFSLRSQTPPTALAQPRNTYGLFSKRNIYHNLKIKKQKKKNTQTEKLSSFVREAVIKVHFAF